MQVAWELFARDQSNPDMGRTEKKPASTEPKSRGISSAVTMNHIAELANVSKATVSRALRNSPLVNEATRKLVHETAMRSGYVVNKNAQKLRDKRTNTIAIALDFPSYPGQRISDPFIFELLSDIVNSLSIREKDVLLCSPDANEAITFQNMLAAKSADGIIFLGQGDKEEMLQELVKLKAPFVVWGGVAEDSSYCTVGSDNEHGGYLVGRRFASLGFSNVLFAGHERHLESRLRRAGLKSGLREGNKESAIIDLALRDFTYESSLEVARHFLASSSEAIPAIFAASDIVAIAFVVALQEVGLVAGKDVAIVGYNDIPVASYYSPAISTVRQDTAQAGVLLVEKLMQILDGLAPKSVRLPTNLIVRAT